MTSYHQHDVVDDSEPEREELRRMDKYKRRCGPGNVASTQTLKVSAALIEITDDEASDGQRHVSETISPKRIVNDSMSTGHAPNLHPVTASDKGVANDDAQSNADDEEPRCTSLARFAYSGLSSALKTSGSRTLLSRQTSTHSSTTENRPPPTKKPSHRFAAFFSDSDIGRVTKCVCCDTRWTARKSAAHKMVHIQSCAKKQSLTDETVRVLLRKEIDAYESSAQSKGKAPVPQDPQTFLEEVVAEAVPRKKGRRAAVGQTVKTISETRDSILERARAIIESSSPAYVDPERIRDFPDFGSGHAPSTQIFGTSALAQTRKTTTSLFNYDDDCEVPSSTQTFVPSRLGLLQQNGHIHSNSNCTHAPSFSSSNEGEAPTASTNQHSKESQSLQSNSRFSYERDESLLSPHASKDFNGTDASLLKPSSNKLVTPRANTKSPLYIPQFKTDETSIFSSPKTKTRKTPVKPVKTPRVKGLMDAESTESLETRIKDHILQDTNLYLRILRYEPIHFDVFLKLVAGESHSSASGKYRLRLRSILDKKAVHYYGAETTKRR